MNRTFITVVRGLILFVVIWIAFATSGVFSRRDVKCDDTVNGGILTPSAMSNIEIPDEVCGFVALAPDRLAAMTRSHEGTHYSIKLINPATNQVSSLGLGERRFPVCLAVLENGAALAVGTEMGRISESGDAPPKNWHAVLQVWDAKNRKLRKSIEIGTSIGGPLLSAHNNRDIYFRDDVTGPGVVHRVNLETGKMEDVFGPTSGTRIPIPWGIKLTKLLAIDQKTDDLVIGAWRQAIVWDTRKGVERLSCELSTNTDCQYAALSSDGTMLATAGIQCIEVWDFTTGKRIVELTLAKQLDSVTDLAFSPDGKFLVAGVNARNKFPSHIVAWRIANWSQAVAFRCHNDLLTAMSFLPNSNNLVTGSPDGMIRIWELDKLPWPKERK